MKTPSEYFPFLFFLSSSHIASRDGNVSKETERKGRKQTHYRRVCFEQKRPEYCRLRVIKTEISTQLCISWRSPICGSGVHYGASFSEDVAQTSESCRQEN